MTPHIFNNCGDSVLYFMGTFPNPEFQFSVRPWLPRITPNSGPSSFLCPVTHTVDRLFEFPVSCWLWLTSYL